jgi:hypothetical protein
MCHFRSRGNPISTPCNRDLRLAVGRLLLRPRVNAVEPLSLLLLRHGRPLIHGLSILVLGQGSHARFWISLEVRGVAVI